jgi:hypothetical protein
MDRRTVREVLGEPSTWSNSVTSSKRLPDMRDAEIVDVFCSGNEISMLTHSAKFGDTLSIFRVPQGDLRERVLGALRPGLAVLTTLDATI